jgi:hypothetical protein
MQRPKPMALLVKTGDSLLLVVGVETQEGISRLEADRQSN